MSVNLDFLLFFIYFFCLSGPSLALCLAREDAVQVWRDLLGPKDVNAVADENREK